MYNKNRFQLTIAPELSQLIFEGDTLELTCRFKKLSNDKRLNNRLFLGTKLNWLVAPKGKKELVELRPSPLLADAQQSYYVSIFQSDYKASNEIVIESKLIIKRTSSLGNSGQYMCSTENFNANNVLNGLNTSRVDIQVVSKSYMDTNSNMKASGTEQANADVDSGFLSNNRSKVYCPQFVTQTYKGWLLN